MKRAVLTILIFALVAVTSYGDDVSLTIYNDNFGLVKQIRNIEFSEGIGEVRFDDVASRIDPTSVHISLKNPGVSILEQNYQYDLVNTTKMMQKYIGSEISIITEGGDLHRGELLSFDGSYVLLRISSGEITITNAKYILDYRFGSMPEGLILKPTLVWLTDSDEKTNSECEVSYLTDGINWHTEYIAVVADDEKNLDLSGWVSIENRSGATYKDATLKLVAGAVNRIQPKQDITVYARTGYAAKGRESQQFEEESFFEYHLYSLSRPATVANNEIKQISLFPESRTKAEKVYTIESSRYNYRSDKKEVTIRVNLEFENSESRGLGMPLPKGKLRVYKADKKGELQFIGEDLIDHTPKNEKIRVFLGEAFDIKADRVKKNVVDLGNSHRRETYEIKIKNHKDEDIVVTVVESMLGWSEWHITKSNIDYRKISAYKVEFDVSVKANAENILTYTIEY